jgi:hypothetical protein
LDSALIDTGSTFTILRKDYSFLVNSDAAVTFHAANGSPIKIYGMAVIHVSIANVTIPQECYVAEVVHNILGIDFLTHAGFMIDPKSQCMSLGGETVPFMSQEEQTKQPQCGCGGSFFEKGKTRQGKQTVAVATCLPKLPGEPKLTSRIWIGESNRAGAKVIVHTLVQIHSHTTLSSCLRTQTMVEPCGNSTTRHYRSMRT